MYVPLPVLIAAGAVLLALLMLALRRRGSRDLLAPPQAAPLPRAWPAGAAPIGDVPPELAAEVRALLAEDRKIEAIKIVRAATNLGLAEAKEMVERM
jgi:hypothetical protein